MLTGHSFIAGERAGSGGSFSAIDPATGIELQPAFREAGANEVEQACAQAAAAAEPFRSAPLDRRALLLEAIASEILDLGDALLERAAAESGLPLARLTGERGRTVGQLRLFAAEVRDGGWQGVRVDPAMPDRQPLPRSDLRLRRIPVGPVAVFGASNFPLAFSVAGGDTASALAAGCPVVVKGHPAHPGTSEMVAGAVSRAVAASGFPAGIFSMLHGTSNDLGAALVRDPRIAAVGFTGSRAGGLALMKIAAERAVPIPVYAEMSSVNPVLLLPAALENRGEALAAGYVASMTMGSGQFCTNPGLVLAIAGPALDRFLGAASVATADAGPATMLSPAIHRAYDEGVAKLAALTGVTALARGREADGPHRGRAALFAIDASTFRAQQEAGHEVFGASSLVVRCGDVAEMRDVLASLEGQLTATLHFDTADHPHVALLLPVLENLAGRIVANGWPTGVEVSHAMVHGGPYPATSDGRSTSVGTLAIDRFLRPVCYQDFPQDLLPPFYATTNGATCSTGMMAHTASDASMVETLIQFVDPVHGRSVAFWSDDDDAVRLTEVSTTYQLAERAIATGRSMSAVAWTMTGEAVDIMRLAAENRVLAPIDHQDSSHCLLTGTGLTHLGSAEGRNKMHQAAAGGTLTDSMRMFLMGVDGGKPQGEARGVQPEWFYKGDGTALVATGADLPSPSFALDGSEEPEIAGIYVIDDAGNPLRLGYALANEFSDHVTERGNYLWLAHSKLRNAALGAELLLGPLPDDVRGTSRIRRNGEVIWEKPFLSGEANMSHSLANLEHHHFKYEQFRRPGDVHVHFFGTATLSFADEITTRVGDVFEIEADPFRVPLRNPLRLEAAVPVKVRSL